jgi:uncharacterized Zn-binding protein involved in type VI secretion
VPPRGRREGKSGDKAIIRVGDRTSHGGIVVEGHQFLIIHGKPAAGVGHRVHGPKCSGSPVIVEGAMNTSMMGISIAVEGMKTSCGATLIASQITDTIEVGLGSGARASTAPIATAAAAAAAATADSLQPNQAAASKDASCDDHFVLIDAHSGEILAHAEYTIVRASGKIEHGVSDGQGNTHMLSSTAEADDIDIDV